MRTGLVFLHLMNVHYWAAGWTNKWSNCNWMSAWSILSLVLLKGIENSMENLMHTAV